MRKLNATLTAIICGTSLAVDAATCETPDSVTVVYANGVLGTITSAAISSVTLCEKYSLHSASRGASTTVRCDLAFNSSQGALPDLYEAALLSVQSSATQFFRILAGLDPMPAAFKTALNGVASAVAFPDVTNGDISDHIAMYHSLAASGQKVVIVAHSEGNFFANLAYANLSAADTPLVGVVGVADPDSYVAAFGPYTTFRTDGIIDLATSSRSEFGLTTLPPNADTFAAPSFSNAFNHDFVAAYLAAGSSLILANIDTVLARLGQGSAGIPTGSVPAGMTDVYTIFAAEGDFEAFGQTFTYHVSDTHTQNGVTSSSSATSGPEPIQVDLPVSHVAAGGDIFTFCKNSNGWIPKTILRSVVRSPAQSCISPTQRTSFAASASVVTDGTFTFSSTTANDETYTCPLHDNPALSGSSSDTNISNTAVNYCYASSAGTINFSETIEQHRSHTGADPSGAISVVFKDDETTVYSASHSFSAMPAGNVTPQLQFVGRVPTNLAPASCTGSVTYNE